MKSRTTNVYGKVKNETVLMGKVEVPAVAKRSSALWPKPMT
jgi:hypothetical protein